MTVRWFAERKGWPLTGVDARLSATEEAGRLAAVSITLHLEGDLDPDQRARLHAAARACRVSRTLAIPVTLTTR